MVGLVDLVLIIFKKWKKKYDTLKNWTKGVESCLMDQLNY